MTIKNTIPDTLFAHSDYALEVSEIQGNTITVIFQYTTQGEDKTMTLSYPVHNGEAFVSFSSVLKAMFEDREANIDYSLENTSISKGGNGHIEELTINIQDSENTPFEKKYTVINGALQSGEDIYEITKGRQRLGKAKKCPCLKGIQ